MSASSRSDSLVLLGVRASLKRKLTTKICIVSHCTPCRAASAFGLESGENDNLGFRGARSSKWSGGQYSGEVCFVSRLTSARKIRGRDGVFSQRFCKDMPPFGCPLEWPRGRREGPPIIDRIAPSLWSSPPRKTRALRLRGLTFALRERCHGICSGRRNVLSPPAGSNKGIHSLNVAVDHGDGFKLEER